MKKFILTIFPYFRIIAYIILIGTFIIIPVSVIEKKSLCTFYLTTNTLCFSCGITRSFSNIMHLNFIKAFDFNPIFAIAICPIFLFIFTEDTIRFFNRLLKRSTKHSLIEMFLLGELF